MSEPISPRHPAHLTSIWSSALILFCAYKTHLYMSEHLNTVPGISFPLCSSFLPMFNGSMTQKGREETLLNTCSLFLSITTSRRALSNILNLILPKPLQCFVSNSYIYHFDHQLNLRRGTTPLYSPAGADLLQHGDLRQHRERQEDQDGGPSESYWRHHGTPHWLLHHQWGRDRLLSHQVI